MKRRFVFTIALVLTIAIGAVGVLQYLIFQAEQYRAIDQRLESTASLLLSSRLSTAELKEFEEVDDIIEEVVGGVRLNQFVLIYGRRGEALYRSKNAFLLPEQLSIREKWQTLDVEGNYVRILTLPLAKQPRSDDNRRTVQVGLIVSEDLLRWRSMGQHILIYGALIVFLIVLTTVLLSQSLLSPLTELAKYLRFLSSRFDPRQTIGEQGPGGRGPGPSLPLVRQMRAGNDEFAELVNAAEAVNETVADGLRRTQAWTAQMAHELKTPLTILRNSLERASRAESLPACHDSVQDAVSEVVHLNRLISGFLEWTLAESTPTEAVGDVHALRLGAVALEVAEKIGRDHPGRIEVEGTSDHLVFARPGFVEQAISNLVINALKYSPLDAPVIVRLSGASLEIEDRGSGIPDEVLNRIGQPFNYGVKDGGGFGLGLAWVTSICHKYGWSLSFARAPSTGGPGSRTIARLQFPTAET